MGWTWQNRPKGITQKEFFGEMFRDGYEVLDVASGSFNRRNVYAAVRHPEGFVFAAVFLTNWAPRSYFNFGYKDMTEASGPDIADCPKRILELLSPLDEIYEPDSSSWKYAEGWRERVRKHNEKMANRVRLKDGLKVCLPYDINFGGWTLKALTPFTVDNAKRKIFSGGYIRPFRLRKATLYDLQLA